MKRDEVRNYNKHGSVIGEKQSMEMEQSSHSIAFLIAYFLGLAFGAFDLIPCNLFSIRVFNSIPNHEKNIYINKTVFRFSMCESVFFGVVTDVDVLSEVNLVLKRDMI